MTSQSWNLKSLLFTSLKGPHVRMCVQLLVRARHIVWNSVLLPLLSDGSSSSMKGDSEMMMMMMGVHSANHSPQSVASSGMDSGVDSLPEQLGELSHVAISLCGGLTDNREITRGGIWRWMLLLTLCVSCKAPGLAFCVCVLCYRAVPGEADLLPAILWEPFCYWWSQPGRQDWKQVCFTRFPFNQ